jgi:hypothetical protein
MTKDAHGTPPGLIYAAFQASGVQAVHLPVTGETVVAIVEPGHDPHVQWQGLSSLFRKEGVGVASADSPAEGETA